MWGFDEFIAKAKLYFKRASDHDAVDDEFALWLLLGLEFLLRAPLANVHPSLLAQPDGDSLLHAVGIAKPDAQPKSVMTKTVVERLKFIITDFSDDRQKDTTFLSNLRNSELHSADATLLNIPEDQWLPRFLAVVETVANHLSMPLEDLLDTEIISHARSLRVQVNRAIEQEVRTLIANSKYLYSHLNSTEIEARKASFKHPTYIRTNQTVSCPACESTALLKLAPGRTTRSRLDEDDNEITYTVIYLAEQLECDVCGLHLDSTAKVTAAGIPRLHPVTYSEDRYEGWEDIVDTSHLTDRIYDGGDDYGND